MSIRFTYIHVFMSQGSKRCFCLRDPISISKDMMIKLWGVKTSLRLCVMHTMQIFSCNGDFSYDDYCFHASKTYSSLGTPKLSKWLCLAMLKLVRSPWDEILVMFFLCLIFCAIFKLKGWPLLDLYWLCCWHIGVLWIYVDMHTPWFNMFVPIYNIGVLLYNHSIQIFMYFRCGAIQFSGKESYAQLSFWFPAK